LIDAPPSSSGETVNTAGTFYRRARPLVRPFPLLLTLIEIKAVRMEWSLAETVRAVPVLAPTLFRDQSPGERRSAPAI
jgi:hypothetical protein